MTSPHPAADMARGGSGPSASSSRGGGETGTGKNSTPIASSFPAAGVVRGGPVPVDPHGANRQAVRP